MFVSVFYDFGYEILDEYFDKFKEKVVLCMRILMWNKLIVF